MKLIAKLAICSLLAININLDTYEFQDLEIQCLTSNIYHEARGESYQGKYAVAAVTMNRATYSVCDAVYAKNQFSWTKHYSSTPRDIKAWEESFKVATRMYYEGSYFSATHYHNNTVKPSWAKKLKRIAKIGNHTFYEKLP